VDTSKNEASDTGVTKDTITLGFQTSVTGVSSSNFADAAAGANAFVEALNAKGGVYGRKVILKVADDQSTVPGSLSAAQKLVQQDKVFAVIGDSPFLFGGYRFYQQQGIPIIGFGFDGPEWRQQPNTNMFSWSAYDPTGNANETDGTFWKKVGATTLGAVYYGNSPSSTASIQQMKTSVEKAGLSMPVLQGVPTGSTDLTAAILKMKSAGVNGAACSCNDDANIAMMSGIKNAQLPGFKGAIAYSGPSNNVFANSSATAAAEGNYFRSPEALITDPSNPGTQAWAANLKKYDPNYKGGFPSFGNTTAYVSADLAATMLQLAGQNPTRKGMMDATRAQLHDYDAQGILATPVSFALDQFETGPDQICFYYPQLKSGQFVDTLGKICGAIIPNSKPKG